MYNFHVGFKQSKDAMRQMNDSLVKSPQHEALYGAYLVITFRMFFIHPMDSTPLTRVSFHNTYREGNSKPMIHELFQFKHTRLIRSL